MKSFLIIFFALIAVAYSRKQCFPVTEAPKCPSGEVYMKKGPGPFCYATCCGPRGPPCRLDSFTSGCFCAKQTDVKIFPVANYTLADSKNPCVSSCDQVNCLALQCTLPNEEYRECGPTSMCDNQVCRGARPICTEEEAATCVQGCFCKEGFSRFNGECISQCPLLP